MAHSENYLGDEDLATASRGWIDKVLTSNNRRKTKIPEGKQSLLIVDAQRFFFESSSHAHVPVAGQIEGTLRELIIAAEAAELPIAATRHCHRPGEAAFPFDAVWNKRLMENDPMSELIADLLPAGSPVFNKSSYSAFQDTGLRQWLDKQRVRILLLAGVTSHLCIESSARHAFGLGYFPVVLADVCASWTEAQHLRTLAAVSDGLGSLSLAEDFIRKWRFNDE